MEFFLKTFLSLSNQNYYTIKTYAAINIADDTECILMGLFPDLIIPSSFNETF